MLDRAFIDEYENGPTRITRLIKGLTREDLLAIPIAGKWSIQQVVIHLADSEGVLADRMKRVIAEDDARLLAFDETRWAAHLHYSDQSAEDAVLTIELIRRQMVRVLRVLPDAAFARRGIHSEAGPMSLQTIVEKAAGHLNHHVQFIVDKREKLGKMMW